VKQKAWKIKRKIDQWDFIQIKNYYASKDIKSQKIQTGRKELQITDLLRVLCTVCIVKCLLMSVMFP
jgi:hypothetical protein